MARAPSRASPRKVKGSKKRAVLVLAAGVGKRMRSALPKVLHPLHGRPVLSYVLDLARPLGDVFVVAGAQADRVREILPKGISSVLQKNQLGTGHAVMAAAPQLKRYRSVLVLSGDTPLIREPTLRMLLEEHDCAGAVSTLLSARLENPSGYGRLVRDGDGSLLGIVEEADAAPDERALQEVNAGTYCFSSAELLECLPRLRRKNKQKEYYLTDVVSWLLKERQTVHVAQAPDWTEILGVNTRMDLAVAHEVLRRRKVHALMEQGVTLLDPTSAYVAPSVEVGADTVLEPNVFLSGATRVGRRCRIGTGAHVDNCVLADDVSIKPYSVAEGAAVGRGASVGPFARLRPGTSIGANARVGNFVETKKASLGAGSKANHLAYLGDARIGKKVNIGAGTITCNYDGVRKHETVVGDGVFVGSDAQFVAPVRVGRGAYVAAGSTITEDVPPHALAVARGRQENKRGWAKKRKRKRAKRK
jgi:bifunctional UDP-N-acetylglucosamine pyrophosphorylase/glucosamine-1-phosphate N-acetyltransferase